jgi:two-component system, chemotaxis family, chemotaxis protein CheY
MPGVRTVLVVDDSAAVAKQLTRILEESTRYKVVAHASDGMAALKQFQQHSPDLVCMDMAMPNMDGVQALRLILHINKEAKVVMVSSVGGVADRVQECLKLGARNVVSKPFDAQKILEVLDSV